MLRLSKKADYALLAMRHLAAHADRGAVSAREVAEAYDLPPELLAKVLQRLVRGRLLTSVQGIRGGYALARPAAAISVADVITAVDGPLTVTACSETNHNCEQYSNRLRAGGDVDCRTGERFDDAGDREPGRLGARHGGEET
jgi:Rrf2 family protein